MSQPLYIAFIWHMHQPYYRDLASGACSMPWVRLHATKDYLDMVTRLSQFPSIHQTFNIVPSLLDQLEEYLPAPARFAKQSEAAGAQAGAAPPANRSDEFLDLSRMPAAQLSEQERRFLLKWFFLANPEHMIKPYPRYHDLLAKRGMHVREEEWPMIQQRFRTQDYLDLQVWFNLAWIDPWLRSQDPVLAALEAKGAQFTEEEKQSVLARHLNLIGQVIPAYRDAAARGQIELSASPYYHPIMPLLCDLRCARVALPNLPLPETAFRHPEDARWQLEQGLLRHEAAFGARPRGVWPSEGGVSEEFVRLAIESNVRWIATDEEILWRTVRTARAPSALYRPHVLRRKHGQIAIIFRDRELSDLIGFVYNRWDPQQAAADFLHRLGDIHQQFQSAGQPALVSIVLDGENAWESYPNDGHDFFMALYGALARDERFRCVTVSEFLQAHPLEHAESLPELFAGSWIDANFATWIGHPEKNAAWTHLAQARAALEPLGREDPALTSAWKSLGIAEGSDWMWWFGDTHFSAQADEFDRLFRTHLANVYQLAGLAIPDALTIPIRRRLAPSLYHPTGLLHPAIDGRETSYYEWLYAGRIDLKQSYAAAQRSDQVLQRLYYGFDQTHYFFRVDLDPARSAQHTLWTIDFAFPHGVRVRLSHDATTTTALVSDSAPAASVSCAFDRLLEVAVPRDLLDLSPGDRLTVAVSFSSQGQALERYPAEGTFELIGSTAELEANAWSV